MLTVMPKDNNFLITSERREVGKGLPKVAFAANFFPNSPTVAL